MAQPTWQTPTGSLGVIPEGIFFQINLLATVPVDPIPVYVTATTAGTNLITCDSTETLAINKVIKFTGVEFGGLESNSAYIISSVVNSTQFQVKSNADSTSPVTLTTATGLLTGAVSERVYYRLQAGTTPEGIQVDPTGNCYGVPQAVSVVQGVPSEVGSDVTSKFTVRAYTLTNLGSLDRFIDRTFSITITGNDPAQWITPAGSIGSYYDSDWVDIQLSYGGADPGDILTTSVVSGSLPLGLTLSSTGRISGHVRPFPNEEQTPGYDLQPYMSAPYDFVSAAISKNYQFTLEVSDGKSQDQRTFSIYVYDRSDLTGDNDLITGDNTFVTSDETTVRAPFLINAEPGDLGSVRSDNNFAYRFIGQDYNNNLLEYAFSVNQGFGTPPGLQLDPFSGWYYGLIPDIGTTEITYSFNIQVRAQSLVVYSTQATTNIITCDSSTRGDFYEGSPVTFEGDTIGGLAENTTYYVIDIVSDTQFKVSYTPSGSEVALTTDTASDLLLCVPAYSPRSPLYPFTLTLTGATSSEVTWFTPADLGIIENGSVSLLDIEAESVSGLPLLYQLKDGAYNNLPQGLTLLPTGEIAGRVSFETFSLDLGATTIDSSTSTITRRDDTTFDATHTFTVNAYSEDGQVPLYEVNAVKVIDGGSGFVTAPTLTFNEPDGAAAVQATANVFVDGSAITNVVVTDGGADYTETATYTLTGAGSGSELQVLMQQTGYRRLVSAFKTFSVRVVRAYNRPYQNLIVTAMPPANDRLLLQDLLDNQEIFVPSYLFRPDDPNFGLSTQVRYQHAFGLAPVILDEYVASLNLNHYRKNLVLGEVKTARALDASGNVIYEVVYSQIVDDLVNAQGASVSKIVTTPYAINNPEPPPELINSVYPNSLINMRDQVIDVVGQISQKLPLWMTSRQSDGQVLGFTPAWVICYANPGRGDQIAYYISEYFGQQLNRVDFQVDRYILDAALSLNWDAETQQWTPAPEETTFDRFNTSGYTDIGVVSACTSLAFDQVNGHTIDEINALGGLDGPTWAAGLGPTPSNTKVYLQDGSKIIFVKQEAFLPYDSTDQAFTINQSLYDSGDFDLAAEEATLGAFDYGTTLTGGYTSECTATSASTDLVTAASTVNLQVNDKVWFTGTVFGGIDTVNSQGETVVYYVQSIASVTGSATNSATDRITVSSVADLAVDDEIWFAPSVRLTISQVSSVDNAVTLGSNTDLLANMKFQCLNNIGNLTTGTTYYIKTLVGTTQVTLSNTPGGAEIDPGTATAQAAAQVGGPIGAIDAIDINGLAVPYYVVNITGSDIEVSDTPGGAVLALTTDSGTFVIYRSAFSVAVTSGAATPLALTTDTGSMTVNYENDRMAIWEVSVEVDGQLLLTLSQETVANDYVTSSQGLKYTNGTYLYRPQNPEQGLTRVNWQPLISAVTTISEETTFDQDSVQWVEPVDMYDPTDRNDKYLVFPKVDILQ